MGRFESDQNPTDHAYAFSLRAPGDGWAPRLPATGTRRDIRQTAREVLTPDSAARFEANVGRWDGPEDEGPQGERRYAAPQLWFEERAWSVRLQLEDLERILSGTALVMRRPNGAVDYLMRDHHTVDVVIDHYRSTGELPGGMFHADRHSDWCRDGYLRTHRPDQAATWWRLLDGLKRPDKSPALREQQVHFTTTVDPGGLPTTRLPGFVDSLALDWSAVLPDALAAATDWCSLDLDYFQPRAQLHRTKGLLRDARFAQLMGSARVRLFVVSPQFAGGGDRPARWVVHGSRSSTLRLLNHLRRIPKTG